MIWYGKGLASVVVMGGMWSWSSLATVMIFVTALCSVCSMASRTLARSVACQLRRACVHQEASRSRTPAAHLPLSVRGSATVTLTVQRSQQTSSSDGPRR